MKVATILPVITLTLSLTDFLIKPSSAEDYKEAAASGSVEAEAEAAYDEEEEEDVEEEEEEEGLDNPSFVDMSVVAQRCVKDEYSVDSIVYALFEDSGRGCKYNYQMTLTAPVGEFMGNYYDSYNQAINDASGSAEAEEELEKGVFEGCQESEYGDYYLLLGCSESSHKEVAVKLYTDEYCLYPYEYDATESALDLSILNSAFDKCMDCVVADEEQSEEEEQDEERLSVGVCLNLWEVSTFCDLQCQNSYGVSKSTWGGKSLFVLLIDVSIFSALIYFIAKARLTLSSQVRLLEESTAAKVGFSSKHIIYIGAGILVLVTGLAVSGIVFGTLVVIGLFNFLLFAYFMKITLFT